MTSTDIQPPAVSPGSRVTPGTRIAGAALSFFVGAVYGAVGTVAHQNVLRIGELTLPVALVLALIGALALLIGFRLVFVDRLAVICAALGMIGVIGLFSLASSGGTVLIPQGVPGLIWTVGPVLIATVVVAWPRMPQRPPASHDGVANVQAHEQHRPEA
ncbi:hypothetical protein IWX78_002349 [Mycetocola sp. CAN_C7]|uniref:hypothetical protein n=1 Tax=Mycetocola sp. CAN_C7 TaxID=2787724 RepID=UPI0018C958EA